MLKSLPACPDCGGSLGRAATKCRCGWKSIAAVQSQAAAVSRYKPCAADPACMFPGLMRMRTLMPDQRLCVVHYCRAIEADRSLIDR